MAVIDGELIRLSDRLDLKIDPRALSVMVPKGEPDAPAGEDVAGLRKLLASA